MTRRFSIQTSITSLTISWLSICAASNDDDADNQQQQPQGSKGCEESQNHGTIARVESSPIRDQSDAAIPKLLRPRKAYDTREETPSLSHNHSQAFLDGQTITETGPDKRAPT
ncbi:hypothetical protein K432DRAFT_394406 [Lepidopterella palustris CBS 459.81]|uniref:Secreted protein n=1 Tax=Lepidopterella palustris CBS 459.81 TaxID=1314670 RepID=A0A8E2E845_9PEZI|nr:hypothetical protein K432DRAFT_394406 [Lepidopterella palustris CBS 459.81]